MIKNTYLLDLKLQITKTFIVPITMYRSPKLSIELLSSTFPPSSNISSHRILKL